MPVGVLSGSGREPYRRGEPVGLGQLLTAAPGLLGGPEIADASEIGTNLAVAIDLRAPPGFDAAQTARTPEERQFKADVVCLVRLGAHIACGRMGRPGEAIRRTEKKCRDLARSPSARTIGSRMRILLSWAKDELRRHGHHW